MRRLNIFNRSADKNIIKKEIIRKLEPVAKIACLEKYKESAPSNNVGKTSLNFEYTPFVIQKNLLKTPSPIKYITMIIAINAPNLKNTSCLLKNLAFSRLQKNGTKRRITLACERMANTKNSSRNAEIFIK